MIYKQAHLRTRRVVGAAVCALFAAASLGAGLGASLADDSAQVRMLKNQLQRLRAENALLQIQTTSEFQITREFNAQDGAFIDLAMPTQTTLDTVVFEPNTAANLLTAQAGETRVADQSPFLGIRKGNEEEVYGAVVHEVVAGSGAADAGLRAGDIIVSFNGAAIAGFEELRGQIRKAAINDTVLVGLLRDGQNLELFATLGGH